MVLVAAARGAYYVVATQVDGLMGHCRGTGVRGQSVATQVALLLSYDTGIR